MISRKRFLIALILDGSPAASTLSLGDGSGNPDNDMHRPAVYGDDATDDCPRWADWTCAASTGGNTKRSVLEEAAVQHLAKRGFSPAWISVKDHKQRGLRKMPSGIRRGGSTFMTPSKFIAMQIS